VEDAAGEVGVTDVEGVGGLASVEYLYVASVYL
jgi:hypothetical protein